MPLASAAGVIADAHALARAGDARHGGLGDARRIRHAERGEPHGRNPDLGGLRPALAHADGDRGRAHHRQGAVGDAARAHRQPRRCFAARCDGRDPAAIGGEPAGARRILDAAGGESVRPSRRGLAGSDLPAAASGRHARANRGRDAFGRRPAGHDRHRRLAPIVHVIAAQQLRGDERALVRGGERDVAFGVGGDLAVPARALHAPVIVEAHAARQVRGLGEADKARDCGGGRVDVRGGLQAPIAHRALGGTVDHAGCQARRQIGGAQAQRDGDRFCNHECGSGARADSRRGFAVMKRSREPRSSASSDQ